MNSMHTDIINTLAPYSDIVLIGSGTGGHISPIVSLAKTLKDKNFLWIGGNASEEEKVAHSEGIPFAGITTLKLATTRSPKVALYPLSLIRGYFQARRILRPLKDKKVCVFSKGGPGSVAIGMAAYSLGIPLYIHESDTIPGRSNTLLGKYATTVFLGFDSAKQFFPKSTTKVVGQILDPSLTNTTGSIGSIQWKTDKKHILVFCGSQGAKSVFATIISTCQHIDAEWIVVLGKLNTDMRDQFSPFINIQILDWLDKNDQHTVFSGTDIAVTRGSATTLAELDIFGIKKIIIPLPHAARNHQYYNALEYQKQGDILLEQSKKDQLKITLQSLIETT